MGACRFDDRAPAIDQNRHALDRPEGGELCARRGIVGGQSLVRERRAVLVQRHHDQIHEDHPEQQGLSETSERIGLFLGITEPEKPGKANGLRTLFAKFNIPMLEHHTGIGGRFSVLSNVGLLPALARGIVALCRRGWDAGFIGLCDEAWQLAHHITSVMGGVMGGVLEPGIEKVEDYLGITNLYESVNTPLISFLNNSIKALI